MYPNCQPATVHLLFLLCIWVYNLGRCKWKAVFEGTHYFLQHKVLRKFCTKPFIVGPLAYLFKLTCLSFPSSLSCQGERRWRDSDSLHGSLVLFYRTALRFILEELLISASTLSRFTEVTEFLSFASLLFLKARSGVLSVFLLCRWHSVWTCC